MLESDLRLRVLLVQMCLPSRVRECRLPIRIQTCYQLDPRLVLD